MKTIPLPASGTTLTLDDGFTPQPISGRDEWIAALRSGKYKQDKKRLRSTSGYCCLGVKRELEGVDWGTPDTDGVYTDETGEQGAYEGQCGLDCTGCLPYGARVKLSQDLRIPLVELTTCNDAGIPFTDIAIIIEHCFVEKV